MRRRIGVEKYLGKTIITKDGMRGRCIGYLPNTNELIFIYGKGGRVYYVKEAELQNN
jgi:hypothetical protein